MCNKNLLAAEVPFREVLRGGGSGSPAAHLKERGKQHMQVHPGRQMCWIKRSQTGCALLLAVLTLPCHIPLWHVGVHSCKGPTHAICLPEQLTRTTSRNTMQAAGLVGLRIIFMLHGRCETCTLAKSILYSFGHTSLAQITLGVGF